ncbi:MAG: hypothetical protein QE277_12405 [Flectobacillus sp.]|nr:hypothetical protein [Flectobacillus sp.]
MNIYPKHYFKNCPNVISGTCFVIMPFAAAYNEIYTVIKETLENSELRLTCRRGDDILRPHILETILENIASAEYIIADLTGQNPNVFYELGLAHCIKDMNKLVLLTQSMDSVPFDLRQYRCILYEQSIAGARKLRVDLIGSLQGNIGQQYTIALSEDEKHFFPERFSGDERFLYELSFNSPAIGNNASKLQIHFLRYSAWGDKEELETQYLYIDLDSPPEKIANIPWQVRLLNAGNRKATFLLQQIR